MKRYIIVLLPQKETSNIIENFRIHLTGQPLVDNLYPHISFKRSFFLNSNFSEENLIEFFKTLSYRKFKIELSGLEYFNDALVLRGESKLLTKAHKELVKNLEKNTSTRNPQWEMSGYKIHLTLLRSFPDANIEPPIIDKVILDRMALYEIGNGDYANLIATTNLT